MANLENYRVIIADSPQLRSTITRSRWQSEAELLLECSKITLDDDTSIKQELKSSEFHKITYGVLSELFRECEQKDFGINPVVSNSLTQSFLTERLEKLDNLLELENVTTLEIDIPQHMKEADDVSHATLQEYQEKVLQVKNAYRIRLDNLRTLSSDFNKNTVILLQELQPYLPLYQDKIDALSAAMLERCKYIYLQLKTIVYESIMHLKTSKLDSKVYKKRRRNFSKQATEILNGYFYSHLTNPYPSEEVKADLATQCNITIGQVSNWFGNKRIRYKRNIGRSRDENIENEEFFPLNSNSSLSESMLISQFARQNSNYDDSLSPLTFSTLTHNEDLETVEEHELTSEDDDIGLYDSDGLDMPVDQIEKRSDKSNLVTSCNEQDNCSEQINEEEAPSKRTKYEPEI